MLIISTKETAKKAISPKNCLPITPLYRMVCSVNQLESSLARKS